MLSDGQVIEKLAKLRAKDKTLWQKIKDFINELAAKIRSVYEESTPDSAEGRYVANLGVDAKEATRLVNAFRNSGVNGKAFADGVRLAFEYGYGNFSRQELARMDIAGNIPQMYINTAYEIGRKMREQESDSGVQYSFKGYADDGKGIYESNFPKGTPKKAKGERILKYIQNVWSKKPITLRINEGGKVRYIKAQFDPNYDETEGARSDARKLMGGNRHGNATEQRVTLDLADDYYQIASESEYNYSKDETGKDTDPHQGVKRWHYFINDIYFAERGSDELTPYRVSINVKENADGDFFYSFSAEKQKEPPPDGLYMPPLTVVRLLPMEVPLELVYAILAKLSTKKFPARQEASTTRPKMAKQSRLIRQRRMANWR